MDKIQNFSMTFQGHIIKNVLPNLPGIFQTCQIQTEFQLAGIHRGREGTLGENKETYLMVNKTSHRRL